MTRDLKVRNTTEPQVGAHHRSVLMRHEVSEGLGSECAGPFIPPKPEKLISAKAKRRVYYGRDVEGPKTTFELEFRTSHKARLVIEVPSPDLLRPERVIDQVVTECGLFPADRTALKSDIENCVNAVVPHVTRTAITGWKGTGRLRAFVTPAQAYGPAAEEHEFASSQDHIALDGQVGAIKGSFKGWRRSVGRYLEMSTAGRVLLGAALAAPLLKEAELGESWIFLLSGKSTTGKSTLLNGVASFQGAASPVSPRTSDRRFNELAAKHNHLLFVVGDLSQLNMADRRRVLHWLTMDATSGQPRSVSRSVRGKLPDLPFNTIAALSSEQTAAEIADGAGVERLVGESVRCFDIMPGATGYFDVRPRRRRLPVKTIAARINDGARRRYGAGLRSWVAWLASKDAKWLRNRVLELIDEFVEKVDALGPLSGLERRAARKFGLVYAGLVLGHDAKIVGVPPKRAFKSVRTCFTRALASPSSHSPEAALAALKEALSAPDAVLRTCQGGKAVRSAIRRNPSWLAIDTKRKGQRMIGLRASAVRKAIGETTARIAFGKLAEGGQLRMPQGANRWQKKIPGGAKIRLMELSPKWLDRD